MKKVTGWYIDKKIGIWILVGNRKMSSSGYHECHEEEMWPFIEIYCI